jgi:hypothetical protein
VLFLVDILPFLPLCAPGRGCFVRGVRVLFWGQTPSASELLEDDIGIEALIDRLEELDESDGWDA